MHFTSKKLFSKIYNNYGFEYYPERFKKKIKVKKKFFFEKKEILRKNKKKLTINLASQTKINPYSIWQFKNERFSYIIDGLG